MAETFGMAAQLLGNVARFAWYWSINRLMTREASRHQELSRYTPHLAIPAFADLMTDVRDLLVADAEAVRDGISATSIGSVAGFADHLARIRAMFDDLPDILRRRAARETRGAEALATEDLPQYFKQDFHFQRGGYLSHDSARLYDVQVETLFYGTAAAMRRAALRPLSRLMRGKDQRKTDILDLACGTGRFLREILLVYPRIRAKGLDLSLPYLQEARRHLADVRPVMLIAGNVERIPLPDACLHVVTASYLFHELPPDVRRQAASEIARVLKPGGSLIFVDSLQFGDRPGWDGLVEAFPHRFHEPYYDHYARDDLAGIFSHVGLHVTESFTAFLSKIMVCQKAL